MSQAAKKKEEEEAAKKKQLEEEAVKKKEQKVRPRLSADLSWASWPARQGAVVNRALPPPLRGDPCLPRRCSASISPHLDRAGSDVVSWSHLC
jgi:hypothetical protein